MPLTTVIIHVSFAFALGVVVLECSIAKNSHKGKFLAERLIGENVQNLDVWHVVCKHQTYCSKHVQCTSKEHGAKVFFSYLMDKIPP